jgi:O-antigen/teichoic acid export membrane protein
MSLARRFMKSSMFRTLETVVSILTGLFMLPFLVSQLGESVYGIWILVASITASFHILDLGFASAVTRFICNALAKHDQKLGKETAWVVYLGLAAVICLLTGVAALLVPVIANPDSPHELIQLLLIITGLNLAIEFPVKAFAGIASYHMRYDLTSISRICFKLLSTAAAITAVLHGYGVVAVALAGLVGGVCSNLTFRIIAYYLEPDLKVSPKSASLAHAKELISFSGWTLIIDVSRMLQERADIWVIGALLSTQLLTVYYVGLRLASYIFSLIEQAVGMTMPLFVRDFADGNTRNMREHLFLFTRLNFLLATLAISGFAVTGKDAIRLWMGPDFEVQQAYNVGLLLLIAKMILFISLPINTVFIASYKPRIMSWLGITETIILGTLLILFLGVMDHGITGASIAVLISYIFARPTLLPVLIAKQLDFKVYYYYTAIFPLGILSTVAGCVTYFLAAHFLYELNLWTLLISKLIIFSAIAFVFLPFFLKLHEINEIKKVLGKYSILVTWPEKLKHNR